MNVHIDSRGFPNRPASRSYDAILVGDSFGIGAEQAEEERLSAQIASRTGLAIYNACSPVRAISRGKIMTLIDQLGMSHGIVFFELMDWSLGHFLLPEDDPDATSFAQWSKKAEYSPLANISRDLVGRLYDGRLMPNPYAGYVVHKTLPDGQPILFQLDDLENSTPDGPRRWAEYFRQLDGELRRRNLRLFLILVPSKYTVYQAELTDAPKTNKAAAMTELEHLTGVPVANTAPALIEQARKDLRQGTLLYWRDDTHWNARGVQLASAQFGTQYAAFLAEGRSPRAMVMAPRLSESPAPRIEPANYATVPGRR